MIERHWKDEGRVYRAVRRRDGSEFETSLPIPSGMKKSKMSPAKAFDLAWLRSPVNPDVSTGDEVVRIVDLFAGCGGLSIGIAEACRALGLQDEFVLANDVDKSVLAIYERNFPMTKCIPDPIETLLDGECGADLTPRELDFRKLVGEIDLVIGGPPCQGHSDFNNHTRNDDPKNELYLRMARFCEVVGPKHVIIENVPGVERDRRRVAQRTWAMLEDLGYDFDSGVIDASKIGVAQKRRRSITIASRAVTPSVAGLVTDLETEARDLSWAISDLVGIESETVFDSAPTPSATNQERINFLFAHDLYELPDEQRPDCHRLKEHTYTAVYGRLQWDRPSPTITTGFGSMGRGRFVHPSERRTVTPHEAARIQYFPDFFDFGGCTRTLLQKVIGNAVPPRLGYAIGLHLLR